MKYVKILFAIALVFTMCSAFSLKKDHSKPVYAFGISASFDIFKEKRNNILANRSTSPMIIGCLLYTSRCV